MEKERIEELINATSRHLNEAISLVGQVEEEANTLGREEPALAAKEVKLALDKVFRTKLIKLFNAHRKTEPGLYQRKMEEIKKKEQARGGS